MKRPRRRAQDLRQAIDCLPARTREAMLEGISTNEIIVGAYTDRDGRICPMLAAHRHGGRTSLASFARAWDRYTGAVKRARPATERELRTLRAMLEASLHLADDDVDLAAAAAAHRDARARAQRPTGERHRGRELRDRLGWAWLPVFRRLDDYEAAVERAQAQHGEDARAERDRYAGVS